jgi:predicted acyltransferase (DUF342 family)
MTLAQRLLFVLALSVMAGAQAALPPQLTPPQDKLTIYSGAAITMGASSMVGGNIMVEAAATLGASTIVGGYIVSGAAVTLGATASVGGYIEARDAGTIGADSTIGGYLTTGDAATLGANTIDGNIMVDGDLKAGAAILVGTKAVITGNLRSGAAASANLGADAIVGGNATAGTALTLGADTIVSGHAQAGTGAVALGVDAAIAGNARAGTSVTLAAGASVGGNITPGSIEQFTNAPKEPIDDQSPQLLQLQAELAAMVAPAANQLPTAMTVSTTLEPGIYHATAMTTTAGIIVTFYGDGTGIDSHWLINSDSFLAFGASTIIELKNAGPKSTITWNSGSYIEVGASAELRGTFFAGSYILTGASTTLERTGGNCGGLFTNTGAVTLGASNIIGAYDCTSGSVEPDHFAIEHDGNAINCLAEDIKISAHKADHALELGYTGTVSLSTSTNHGNWSWVSGGLAANLTNSGSGIGSFLFDGSENGSVVLALSNTISESVNINISDGSVSELSGAAISSEDQDLLFEEAGFRFVEADTNNPVGLQISGKPSNIGYGAQNLVLQAIKTNPDTLACEAALTGIQSVQMRLECTNPASCQRPIFVGASAPSNLVNTANTAVNFDFGNASENDAVFVMNYPDAGAINIHAEHTLLNGAVMQGNSNIIWRPFGFDLDVTHNPAATDHTGGIASILTAAGNPFTVTATAVLWDSNDDSNNDGIPDNHNDSDPSVRGDLSNNSVTLGSNNYNSALNFGLENENITLTAELSLPSGGNNPLLSDSIISNFANGTGSNSGVIYHEVGIIELNATISDNDYLNIGESETLKMLSKSGFVGRFIPASFDVAVTKPGSFDNTCTTTGITPFTYIGQDFGYLITPTFSVTAKNASNVTTENYRDNFVKLGVSSITVNSVTEDSTNVGSDNVTPLLVSQTVNAAMTAVADNNGTVNYTLGADRFKYGPDPESLNLSKETNSEVYPFTTDIDPVISFVDDGEVANAVSQAFNIEGNDQRFGRINMTNTHGSELNVLQMPMIVEYFNASGLFVINTDDYNCTQINTGDLDITLAPLTSTSIASITNMSTEAGRQVTITAPGNGKNDVVQVSLNLETSVNQWLRYDWDSDGNFNDDPSATATFGINRGNKVLIFMRQTYQ